MEGVGGVGPPLHQRMKGLVVGAPLSVRQGMDKVLKPYILDPILHIIEKLIIPRVSPMEVPDTFEGVGIMLQNELESYISRNRELFKTCKIIFRNPTEEAIASSSRGVASAQRSDRLSKIEGMIVP